MAGSLYLKSNHGSQHILFNENSMATRKVYQPKLDLRVLAAGMIVLLRYMRIERGGGV